MLSNLQYRLLRWAYPTDPERLSGEAYRNRNKLTVLLGEDIFQRIQGKTVVDFGCGYGEQTVEIARSGAAQTTGVDVRQEVLDIAREKSVGVGNVSFTTPEQCPQGSADFVISLDSFEHFDGPGKELKQMSDLLKPGGTLLASFGPPWKHPWGGHSFSVFLWSHLLLSESALCRWYNETHGQKVSRFEEVSGGLNRLTVAGFEALVRSSAFREVSINPVPIGRLKRFHNALTREYFTSVVKCELRK